MQNGLRGLVLFLLGCCSVAWAGGKKDAENAFRDSVMKQQLVLRSFSGADQVHAVWTGAAVEFDQPQWRMIGVLDVNSVQMKHGELRLLCSRHVLMRDASDKLTVSDDVRSVEIDVELKGADPVQVFPQLKEKLFYSSLEDAVAAVPKQLQFFLPGRVEGLGPVRTQQAASGDCDAEGVAPIMARSRLNGLTPPKPLYTPDPEYSDEARRAGVKGRVFVALVVDESGRPTDLWVARAAGSGLDEMSVDAVRQYQFQPATCHGTPIGAALMVEVSFNIYGRRRY